jgi:catechol 2,3-dioxygenase-like lactoylglutathione lyase family enzyme
MENRKGKEPMKKQFLLALIVLAALATPVFAQIAPPNAMGVAVAHMHINATDVEAQQKFFTLLGGKIVNREKIVMAEFPGILVLIRKQDSTGGSVGSAINHFGFFVPDTARNVEKWTAAGLKFEPGTPGQGFITGPDGVRIEIYENKTISTPVAMHHIHLQVTDDAAAQKWYIDHFGGTAGTRLQFKTINFPGAEITLSKVATAQAPTKGRSVDHMGFEVKNIEEFVKKLQASGIKTDGAIRSSTNAAGIRLVYVTDPWGTEIEITEGLRPTS